MKQANPDMFNKKASNPKNKPDEIIHTLNIVPGQFIADVGSGGGYFTYRFAELVGPKGKVYTIDTNKEFLAFVSQKAKQQQHRNITTILASEGDIPPFNNMMDLIFMRNVCHHIQNRGAYFKKLHKLLKADGKVAIIEYTNKGSRFGFHRLFGHYILPEVIIQEMVNAGYHVEEQYFFLPEQSFIIFSSSSD